MFVVNGHFIGKNVKFGEYGRDIFPTAFLLAFNPEKRIRSYILFKRTMILEKPSDQKENIDFSPTSFE